MQQKAVLVSEKMVTQMTSPQIGSRPMRMMPESRITTMTEMP